MTNTNLSALSNKTSNAFNKTKSELLGQYSLSFPVRIPQQTFKHLVQESSYHCPNISSPKSLMLKGSYCTYQERGRGVFQTHQTTHVMFCTELDLDVSILDKKNEYVTSPSMSTPRSLHYQKRLLRAMEEENWKQSHHLKWSAQKHEHGQWCPFIKPKISANMTMIYAVHS